VQLFPEAKFAGHVFEEIRKPPDALALPIAMVVEV